VGVATWVCTGVSVEAVRRARQIEREIKEQTRAAEQIRQKVRPLMVNMKRLSPQQREAATELLSKADEMELNLGAREVERQQILKQAAPQGKPYVLVHTVIYPGVRVSIGARETVFDRILHGPVRIEERKVNEVTEMVAVNQRTGSVTVLRSAEVSLETVEEQKTQDAGGRDGSQPGARRRS